MCSNCGCCDCSCAGNLFYVIEKIISCCAITAATCCIAITLAISIGIGVGVGYNYCFVEIKGNPSTTTTMPTLAPVPMPEPMPVPMPEPMPGPMPEPMPVPMPEPIPVPMPGLTLDHSESQPLRSEDNPTYNVEQDEKAVSDSSNIKYKQTKQTLEEENLSKSLRIEDKPTVNPNPDKRYVLPLALHDKDVDFRFLINMLRARNRNVTLELYT